MVDCSDCVFYDLDGKCAKGLKSKGGCPEFMNMLDAWLDAWLKFCEWVCENNIYDDVTKACECWEEMDDIYDDIYDDYDEDMEV